MYRFIHGSPLHDTDPTGEETDPFKRPYIVIEPGKQINSGQCGSLHSAKWEFRLERGLGDDRVRDAGYIVQKVTVECEQADCECGNCGAPRKQTYSYFEAWYVKAGASKPHGTNTYTDMAWATPTKFTCGKVWQKGEVRFYSTKLTGDLGRTGRKGDWNIHQTYPVGAAPKSECSTTPGPLPSTADTPRFWSEVSSQGERLFELDWNCCGSNDRVDMNADPDEEVTNGILN